MGSEMASNKASANASYLRTIDPLEAVAAKQAIGDYFTPAPEPTPPAARAKNGPIEPKWAIWVIGGGIALVIAGLLSFVFLPQLPHSMQSIPGLYLGIGGVIVIALGTIYAAIWERKPGPDLSPVQIAANKAHQHITRQIEHFQKFSDDAFDKARKGAPAVRRAHLVGIGRKEWNGMHEVPIIEVKGKRIDAAVVHLVSMELCEKLLLVRQVGLQLTTGTTFAEASSQHLLSDIRTAFHDERKLVATKAWETATEIARKIKRLKDSGYDDTNEDIRKLKDELGKLDFEEPAGNRFVMTFANGDRLELVVADCDHPNNRGDIGYPIGGMENLKAATAMWDAIAVASENAKAAQHTAVTGVKDGLDAYQRSVVDGLAGVRGQLASLESVMKEVLVALRSGTNPGGQTTAVAAQGYSNGQAEPTRAAPTAVWPAPAHAPQPEPTKTGA